MRRRALLRPLLAVPLLNVLVRGRARAQAPVFPAGVDVVHVTVTVRNADGRLAMDLAASEFEVREDGRVQAVQVFGRSFDPAEDDSLALDLGMLMDTSASMLEELKLSQEAAARFLAAVPRGRELTTVFFDDDIRISRYDSDDQQGLFERIHGSRGGGRTALYDAIAAYLSRLPGGGGRQVMVLFTDGEDSVSELTEAEVLALLRASPVTAYVIAFGTGVQSGSALRARGFLERVSRITGGQVFAPTRSRDLPEIYRRITEELAAQYVLGYVPQSSAGEGGYRKLSVVVRRPGVKVRHREGYGVRRARSG